MAVLDPLAVEDLEGDVRVLCDLFDDPCTGGVFENAGSTGITAGAVLEGGKPVFAIAIPPVFDGAGRVVISDVVRPGAEGCQPEAVGQQKSGPEGVLNEVEHLESGQGVLVG